MEELPSIQSTEKRIPKEFVFPLEQRPGELALLTSKAHIPIVDLHHDEKNTIQNLMKASQDFGFFQVINHGVAKNLIEEVMELFEKLFNLPHEEKEKINMKEDTKQVCRFIKSSYNYETEDTHYWRSALRHSCFPMEECIQYWPQNPENYREIVGAYVIGLKNLGSRILDLMCQGLAMEQDYFRGKLSEEAILTVNHYPPCPDPTLTLGLSKHADPNLITILLPGPVPGLQIFKDGHWKLVQTLPNAFLAIIGSQLEIVSNGKLRSGIHRVVTNTSQDRISSALFIGPPMDCTVEPAKPLIQANDDNPPLYKAFLYKDFFKVYIAPSNAGNPEGVLQAFKINP